MKQREIFPISWKEVTKMTSKEILKKNKNFYIGVIGTVLEESVK